MTSFIGESLQNGKYILEEELGRGGYGITYKAIERTRECLVVIKTINPELLQGNNLEKFKKQFKDEARKLKRLRHCSHPNIVGYLDDFVEEQLPYIVMDFIPGKTLAQIALPNNPLPEAQALEYIRQVGEALKVLHRNGLLHRDVKPQNLILHQDTKKVVLIDFGIAREFNEFNNPTKTNTNVLSEGYAALEQYFPRAKLTPATDVYGLSATLYSLLTAQVPVGASLRSYISLASPRQLRPRLSETVSQAVLKGMELEIGDRPANVDKWLNLLPKTEHSHQSRGGMLSNLHLFPPRKKPKTSSSQLAVDTSKESDSGKGYLAPVTTFITRGIHKQHQSINESSSQLRQFQPLGKFRDLLPKLKRKTAWTTKINRLFQQIVNPPNSIRLPGINETITRRKLLKLLFLAGGSVFLAILGKKIWDSRDIAHNLDLKTFQFEILTVNKRGQKINSATGKAQYFSEVLPNGLPLEMVAIPGGKFSMGTPGAEKNSKDNELPQHQVAVKSFFMGKFPVTQAQWRAVAALPKIDRDLNPNPSKFPGNNRPVDTVSWDEAIEFCQRLSKKTGKKYRLPSEAEWEYACRAQTTTPFHFGETLTTNLANYDGLKYSYASEPKGIFRNQTQPVGSFSPNAFGLYDMHGNIWEWCFDHWHVNYEGAPKNGRAWLSNSSNQRVLRGGSWHSAPWNCRSSRRENDVAHLKYHTVGFRVAMR